MTSEYQSIDNYITNKLYLCYDHIKLGDNISEVLGTNDWKYVVESRNINERVVTYAKSDIFNKYLLIESESKLYKIMPNFVDDADTLRGMLRARDEDDSFNSIFDDELPYYREAFNRWNQKHTCNITHKHSDFILMEYFQDYKPLQVKDLLSPVQNINIEIFNILPEEDDIKSQVYANEIYKEILEVINEMSNTNSFENTHIYNHYMKADVSKLGHIKPYSQKKCMTVLVIGQPIIDLIDLTDIIVLKNEDGVIVDWKIAEPNYFMQPLPEIAND